MISIMRRFLSVSLIWSIVFFAIFTGFGANLYANNAARNAEVLQIIREHALFPPPQLPSGKNISLKDLLLEFDPFSDFLSPDEYAAFLKNQKSSYVGVGMEVIRNSEGKFICIPFPDSSAARAGIKDGDILIAVNGVETENQSVYFVASQTVGPEDTHLVLTIQNGKGEQETVAVIREKLEAGTVSLQKRDNLCLITISHFSTETLRELKLTLDKIPPECPIIIDLRGNTGGVLHSAIDSAMLFLDKGQEIIERKERNNSTEFLSTTQTRTLRYPLYIFQNSRTASAAEVFSAALTQNSKAVSIGETTYGKGVSQQIFNISDGSALFLTTAFLVPPDGTRYNGKGLSPDYPVSGSQTEQYVSVVQSLVKPGPSDPTPKDSKTTRQKISPKNNTTKKVTSAPAQEKSDNHFFACVDRKFTSNQEALRWSFKLKTSGKLHLDPLIFQNVSSGVISYLICFGPETERTVIEKKKRALARQVGVPAVIKIFNEDEPPPENKVPLAELPQKTPEVPGIQSRYIQAGSYKSMDGVIAELSKIREKNQSVPLWVDINAYGKDQVELAGMQKEFEELGFKVGNILNPAKKAEGDLRFRIFVGPYFSNNTEIMDVLKKGKIIPKDAFWYRSVQAEK